MIMQTKRIFFRKGPLDGIEYGPSGLLRIGFFFDRGGYEDDEIVFTFAFRKWCLYITLKKHIKTVFIHKDKPYGNGYIENKQRTFGIMIGRNYVSIGTGRAGDRVENETKKTFYFSNILGKRLNKKNKK